MASEMNGQENCIRALNLEALPDEQKFRMIEELSRIAQKRALSGLLPTLSEEGKAALKHLFEEKGPDAEGFADFLRTYAPTFDALVSKEVEAVKRELYARVSEQQEAVAS